MKSQIIVIFNTSRLLELKEQNGNNENWLSVPAG